MTRKYTISRLRVVNYLLHLCLRSNKRLMKYSYNRLMKYLKQRHIIKQKVKRNNYLYLQTNREVTNLYLNYLC